MAIVFGTVLPWLLIALGSWLGYQMVRQNGRILLRLEAIERNLRPRSRERPPEAKGLPLDTPAPEFELPDLAGVRRKLTDFRGKDLLLIFFNPGCGFCTKMADDLAAITKEGSDSRVIPLVITTGDLESNRNLIKQHGIRCTVLLQEEMQVAAKYQAHGTPMGYRIDPSGRIASELVVGAEPLLRLASGPVPKAETKGRSQRGSSPRDKEAYHSLSRSRLKRDGLPAGTVAPEFQLPRIDGGELSLSDFRGRRVLLVFSDPECGPCDELAPQLQELHLRRRDLQILMVSRREMDANRSKAAKLGLSFPIAVQSRWDISLKYAMFATPIGYLIDEEGVIVRDVAIGVEPILGLAEEMTPAAPESLLAGVETPARS